MGQLGFPELIVIAIIAVLVFGPKKLPDLGSGLGKAIREFKSALNDSRLELNEPERRPGRLPETNPSEQTPATTKQ